MPAVKKLHLPQPVGMFLLGVLLIAGAASLAAAIVHAPARSQDFQWSGVRLLLHHIDPWRDYLQGDPVHGLLGTQVPNYLPVLFVLLTPFGFLSATHANLAWAVCNAVFLVMSGALAARFYGRRNWTWTITVIALLAASTPARVTIGNGQQGLFVLALCCMALLTTGAITPVRGMLVGISYLKYSFAPPIALYLLLRDGVRRGARTLLWTFVPSAVATLLVWLWLTGGRDVPHLFALVTEPLAVTHVGYQPTGDPAQTLMDLFEYMLGGNNEGTPRLTLISLIVALALTLALLLPALRHARTMPDPVERTGWLLALVMTASFVLYKHHPYDEVVFLFALCYALRHWRRRAAMATLFLIAYAWYIQPIVDVRIVFSFAWCWARISILFALLLCIYRIPFERDGLDAKPEERSACDGENIDAALPGLQPPR